MRIVYEIAKVTTACAGMEGYDSEVVIEDITDEGFKKLYIHANAYETTHYTVTEKSLFAEDLDEINFIEEYESIDDAKGSIFYKYFLIADRMLNEITGCE